MKWLPWIQRAYLGSERYSTLTICPVYLLYVLYIHLIIAYRSQCSSCLLEVLLSAVFFICSSVSVCFSYWLNAASVQIEWESGCYSRFQITCFKATAGLPPPFRAALSPIQRCWHCYAARSELSSLAWDPLFVLQRCTILLWPWSTQFGDGDYNFPILPIISYSENVTLLYN
jgi:hypothetical protein